MAEKDEPQLPLDQVEHYVFGRLTPVERRHFEMCLELSAELRALVREMEAGLVALALSAPPRTAPPEAWQNIQARIARRQRWQSPLAQLKWLLNGWAVATCLTAAFLVHAFWIRPAATANLAAYSQPAPEISHAMITAMATNVSAALVQNSFPAPGQTNALQKKITQLENQLATLRQAAGRMTGVTASEPPRDAQKFSTASRRTRLSPKMQQTMLRAMARQLGMDSNQELLAALATSGDSALAVNDPITAVDFIDLPQPGVDPTLPTFAATSPFDRPQDEPATDPDTIPMIAWDRKILALIDPATLHSATAPLTVWATDSTGTQFIVGTVTPGGNPMVVTLPGLNLANDEQYLITVGSSNSVVGHLP